ncbi:MAG TPA: ABC transporter ATP-binding protein, partial [Chthoniobacterales bacterium]|nr:ABC transporter ATP-binding protein [Chthoniobacterales bacterium]
RNLFRSLLERPAQFFHKHDSDQLTMIVNQFSMQVQTALQSLLIDPILNIIGMIILGASLYTALAAGARDNGAQLWIFFAVIVLIALLSPWLVALMGRKLQESSLHLQQHGLLVQSLVGGALKAPEEIQAMRAESIFDRKHGTALDASLRSRVNQTTTIEKLNAVNRLPGEFVLAALLGLAVFAAISGTSAITPKVVILLFTLTPQFMGAVQGLSAVSITASMNWPAVDTVDNLLSSQTGERVAEGGAAIESLEPTLEAKNIVFRYPGASKYVLNDVSFTVPPGKVSGFVAKAGQGKTTFFRLALRFYEPENGRILIGGVPHTELQLGTLRQHVVLMHQMPAFFHDTIRENFLIANPAATDADIQALCEKTPLWRILNDAYGSNPLDRQFVAGNSLSGGQKKLFAITRCLLRNPTILLLDEPTTGIDPSEKFELVAMMRQACAGRTVMVVDHDVVGWQVLFCDHIFVLNNGKLEQEGAPGELLQRGGLFKDLFDDQAEGFHKMAEAMRVADAKRLHVGDSSPVADATMEMPVRGA